MLLINTVLLLFLCPLFAEDVENSNDANMVYLGQNDPYIVNIPKLLNISLNGTINVVHSNVDQISRAQETCNGIEVADLEKFTQNVENKLKNTIEEMKNNVNEMKNNVNEMKKLMKEMNTNMNNISTEIATIKKNISDIYEPESIEDVDTTGVNFRMSSIRKRNFNSNTGIPESCKQLLNQGNTVSGIYKIRPNTMTKSIAVLCDMDTRGGGWTHIHKRYDATQDFDLNWVNYKNGFGNLEGEFWIGLENIYQMTRSVKNELLVEIVDKNGKQMYALYTQFALGPESSRYTLTILQGYSGDVRDSLTPDANSKFGTKDYDQTLGSSRYSGGWWFNTRDTYSNLNGKNLKVGYSGYNAMFWWRAASNYDSLSKARMLIRPA